MIKGTVENGVNGYRNVVAGLAFILSAGFAFGEENPRDPYEGFNRVMYSVNDALDKVALKPVAKVYDMTLPLPVKAGVGNFFGNTVIYGLVPIARCKVSSVMPGLILRVCWSIRRWEFLACSMWQVSLVWKSMKKILAKPWRSGGFLMAHIFSGHL
jgi:hypothetical protein